MMFSIYEPLGGQALVEQARGDERLREARPRIGSVGVELVLSGGCNGPCQGFINMLRWVRI